MRIHCLENVDKALQFLKEQRVHLENMGSHDIVDGNHRLVLGLIWTIILRFQVGPGEQMKLKSPLKADQDMRTLQMVNRMCLCTSWEARNPSYETVNIGRRTHLLCHPKAMKLGVTSQL